jgi:hypothetical protein
MKVLRAENERAVVIMRITQAAMANKYPMMREVCSIAHCIITSVAVISENPIVKQMRNEM